MTSLFSVSKEVEFDAGHRVPNHKSACRNPHGHRYRVSVTVDGPLGDQEGTSDEGMVLDFGDIKRALTRLVHDRFDHGFIVYEGDSDLIKLFLPEGSPVNGWNIIEVGFIPTAENIAKYCYDMLSVYLNSEVRNIKVRQVDVWETPTSMATYPAF